MASRKPRSAVDALGVDYETPRPPGPRRDINDPLVIDGGMVIPALTDAERAARNAAAVRYLRRRGAEDLIDMLGLGAEPERRVAALVPRLRTVDVSCPLCEAGIGQPCVTRGNTKTPHHERRRRKAAEERERRAAA